MGKYNFRAAIGAGKAEHSLRLAGLLESRWDRFVEAVATQLMSGLQCADRVVGNVCENPFSYFAARVACALSRPIHKTHTLVFEFPYFRRQRRLLTLARKNLLLCGNDDLLKLDNLAVELLKVSKLQHRLSNVAGGT
jgi:hypothetical protein